MRSLPITTLHSALLTMLAMLAAACGEPTEEPLVAPSGRPGPTASTDGKADYGGSEAFPAEADLALVLPMGGPGIAALEVLPAEWLGEVSDALARSDLDESIQDESWPEDWKLVSARVVTCSPLGRIADPDEIDRICWPQVRLVWQPIVEDIRIASTIRPQYADDRAIHSLYRVAHDDPHLTEMLARLEDGARLSDLDARLVERFESARDAAGIGLLRATAHLRGAERGYGAIDLRPEMADTGDSDEFLARLRELLRTYTPPGALHELTAFSLPLGRNPAAANLWSFVAFSGREGRLTQTPLSIHDPATGHALYAFPASEDVTAEAGDPELLDALEEMAPEQRAALTAQVITDTRDLETHADRINDPYRTLVPNTSCASCHRMTDLNFNFHNLSYFEDNGLSVAPRVRNDVARDLSIARRLWDTQR
jgi:hypothetical protein